MNLRIIIAVIAVPILAAAFAWSTAWWVRSTMSEDSNARRRARFVEILLWFGMMGIFTATAQPGKEQKIFIVIIFCVAALWASRGGRFLLHRRRMKNA